LILLDGPGTPQETHMDDFEKQAHWIGRSIGCCVMAALGWLWLAFFDAGYLTSLQRVLVAIGIGLFFFFFGVRFLKVVGHLLRWSR
jgi:hypothetical protein